MARSHRRGAPAGPSSSTSASASGTQVDALTARSNEEVQDIAKAGATGAGHELPFLDRIQESFGDYDVSGVKAHTDRDAAADLSANAYSVGSDVVFGGSPSLSTAAEEATHSLQQAAGRAPNSGVGQEGDSFEREADQVAQRVTSGQSAVDLLDRITGGARGVSPGRSLAVQREANPAAAAPIKEVTSLGMGRLMAAQMGIEHTKEVLAYGAGNQKEALEETNFNSYFRMQAMRTADFWQATPEAMELAQQHPQALTAAKARHAQGGNCGEHAQVAFDYLRQNLGGDLVRQVDVSGLDHAFIMIGDPQKDNENDLVICDPWPTKPVACLWVDHFAYTNDSSKINERAAARDDTEDYAQQIYDGLVFTDAGQQYAQQSLTDEQVQEQFKLDEERRTDPQDRDGDGEIDHNWIWEHSDTQVSDRTHRYRMPEGTKADSSAYTGSMMDDVRAFLARGRRQ